MEVFPLPLLPGARVRQDGQIWVDETYPLDTWAQQDAAAYDERSKTFDQRKAFDRKRPHFTDPLRALGKDSVVLEIAAGRAAHSLALLREGYRVIVSDISQGSVRWVAETAREYRIEGRGAFIALDGQHLPFASATIDGIFLTAALHHFHSSETALRECRRVLKPGGVLLVGYEPAKWSYRIFKPIWDFLKRVLRRGSHHTHSQADDETEGFTMEEMRSLALLTGFHHVRVQAVDFLEKIYEHVVVLFRKLLRMPDSEYRPGARVLRSIDRFFARIPLIRRLSWNYDLAARA